MIPRAYMRMLGLNGGKDPFGPLAMLQAADWMVDEQFTQWRVNSANTLWTTVNAGGVSFTTDGPKPGSASDVQGISKLNVDAATFVAGTKRGNLGCIGVDGILTGMFYGVRLKMAGTDPATGTDDYYFSSGLEAQAGGVAETDDGITFCFEHAAGGGGTWKCRAYSNASSSEVDTGIGWDTADYHTFFWQCVESSTSRSGGADIVRVYADGTFKGEITTNVQPSDDIEPHYAHAVKDGANATNNASMLVDRFMYGVEALP